MPEWGFVTNYGLVLAAIAKKPSSTAREIGDYVGITERTAHKIINDLKAEGYVAKTKVGRQNQYQIQPDMPMRDGASDAAVGELLSMLGWKQEEKHGSSSDENISATSTL
jgi:predicted ArsR family transcriptional regulator